VSIIDLMGAAMHRDKLVSAKKISSEIWKKIKQNVYVNFA